MPLEARQVSFRYGRRAPVVLESVDFAVDEGERVGIVAPSGYGKTTLIRLLAGYLRSTRGEVLLDGRPLPASGRSPIQLINQHPEHAINPRWRMHRVLEEAGQLRDEVLDALGLERKWLNRYPRELSGGELQRFSVARALYSDARYVLADEISTMLDVITQAQIWHYLLDEAARRNLGLVVITHNRHLAERVCERVVDLRDLNRVEPPEQQDLVVNRLAGQ